MVRPAAGSCFRTAEWASLLSPATPMNWDQASVRSTLFHQPSGPKMTNQDGSWGHEAEPSNRRLWLSWPAGRSSATRVWARPKRHRDGRSLTSVLSANLSWLSSRECRPGFYPGFTHLGIRSNNSTNHNGDGDRCQSSSWTAQPAGPHPIHVWIRLRRTQLVTVGSTHVNCV